MSAAGTERTGGSHWQFGMGAILALVGFLFVIQFRANRPFRQQAELPSVRARDLAVLIDEGEKGRRGLQSEVETLRGILSEYETAAAQGRSIATTMRRDALTHRMILGLVPVEGPGVVVKLKETGRSGAIVAPVVQAQDLSILVNELWGAGAEAIAINRIRILATTGFRQDDRGIALGTMRLQPPYELMAIGDPTAIRAALQIRGGFLDGARAIGIAVEVAEQDRLILPAVGGPTAFRYATPISK